MLLLLTVVLPPSLHSFPSYLFFHPPSLTPPPPPPLSNSLSSHILLTPPSSLYPSISNPSIPHPSLLSLSPLPLSPPSLPSLSPLQGNVILTDYNYVILNLLRTRTDADAEVRFAVRETFSQDTVKREQPLPSRDQ